MKDIMITLTVKLCILPVIISFYKRMVIIGFLASNFYICPSCYHHLLLAIASVWYRCPLAEPTWLNHNYRLLSWRIRVYCNCVEQHIACYKWQCASDNDSCSTLAKLEILATCQISPDTSTNNCIPFPRFSKNLQNNDFLIRHRQRSKNMTVIYRSNVTTTANRIWKS